MSVEMQEMANEINKIKRSSSHACIVYSLEADSVSQVTNYKRTSEAGSSIRIRQQITTSHSTNTTMEPQRGLYKVTPSRNGGRRVRSCGSMANVRISPTASLTSQ